MINDIKYFLSEKEKLKEKLKVYVKDKSIPLEIRWGLFCESELGDTDACFLHLECVDLDSFYAEYEVNKYQTIESGDVLFWITKEYPEKEKEAMEEILDQFIDSFIHNW